MDDKQRIANLTYALGIAIGALEVIQICPHHMNQEGVGHVLKRLKLMAGEPIIIEKDNNEPPRRPIFRTIRDT